MVKSIAIVGAGPAGLVTCKTLLRTFPPGTISVTVFEAADHVGGLWSVRKGENGGKISPDMPTNLSRFTVSFSDFPWRKSYWTKEESPSTGEDQSQPLRLFPRAWQVGKYLEAYATKFIPEGVLNLKCKVTRAERVEVERKQKWILHWTKVPDLAAQGSRATSDERIVDGVSTSLFDYLVVASGFQNSPRPLRPDPFLVWPENSFPIKLLHSSKFRHISDVVPNDSSRPGKIVVIGGGISGVETAASAALQISSAKYSPSSASSSMPTNHQLYHVVARPLYALPDVLPQDPGQGALEKSNSKPDFAPVDFCLFDLKRRPKGPITPSNGIIKEEFAKNFHQYFASVIGDQGDIGAPGLTHRIEDNHSPPIVGLMGTYAEFVRSGDITQICGRVKGFSKSKENTDPDSISISVSSGQTSNHSTTTKDSILNDVVGIIYANGYTSITAFDWIAEDVLTDLQYDRECDRLPFLLHRYSYLNPKIPNMAFVGFYEGPFWGVIEMQARSIARKWALESSGLETHFPFSTYQSDSYSDLEEMKGLRTAIMQKDMRVPQFWMGDYTGLMEGLANELDIKRSDLDWVERRGAPIPARYVDFASDRDGSNSILQDFKEILHEINQEGRYVARAVFRAMQGPWRIHRKIHSFMNGFPQGELEGTANCHPRLPTDQKYDGEYLYIESGELKTESGLLLRADKRYVYRYEEATDEISAWFVKDDGKTVDYLFHKVMFLGPDIHKKHHGWTAEGRHLCGKDWYDSKYEFHFFGVSLSSFAITYVVKGPKKDQLLETRYER